MIACTIKQRSWVWCCHLFLLILFGLSCQSKSTERIDFDSNNEKRATKYNEVNTVRAESVENANGLYYGKSNDSNQYAEIIRLTDNNGAHYKPLGNVKISDVRIGDAKDISFVEGTEFGEYYNGFKGILLPDGMRGWFLSIDEGSEEKDLSENSIEDEIIFKKVSDDILESNVGGYYSNVEYNEESGDLGGLKLVLIPTETGFFGAFSSFEGTPYPQAVTVRSDANKFWFDVKDDVGTQRWEGKFTRDGLELIPVGDRIADDVEPELLLKKQSLADFLMTRERP